MKLAICSLITVISFIVGKLGAFIGIGVIIGKILGFSIGLGFFQIILLMILPFIIGILGMIGMVVFQE